MEVHIHVANRNTSVSTWDCCFIFGHALEWKVIRDRAVISFLMFSVGTVFFVHVCPSTTAINICTLIP